MPLLRNFAGGLRDLFRKNRNQQELNEELQGFLEAAIEDKMRAGMDHAQALRAARIEMGSAAAVHDQVRGSGWNPESRASGTTCAMECACCSGELGAR